MNAVPGAFAKKFRCLCCNNPWNQSNDDSIGGSSSASGALATFYCAPCLTDDKGYAGIDPNNFDPSVNLKSNFFLWSNGGWKKNNPIPAAYSSWNTFIVLRDLNLDRLKGILDEMAADQSTERSVGETKLADYFNAYMDEERIEERGVAVLSDMAEVCAAAKVMRLPPKDNLSIVCYHRIRYLTILIYCTS